MAIGGGGEQRRAPSVSRLCVRRAPRWQREGAWQCVRSTRRSHCRPRAGLPSARAPWPRRSLSASASSSCSRSARRGAGRLSGARGRRCPADHFGRDTVGGASERGRAGAGAMWASMSSYACPIVDSPLSCVCPALSTHCCSSQPLRGRCGAQRQSVRGRERARARRSGGCPGAATLDAAVLAPVWPPLQRLRCARGGEGGFGRGESAQRMREGIKLTPHGAGRDRQTARRGARAPSTSG